MEGSPGPERPLAILLVEDSRTDAELLASMLRHSATPRFDVTVVRTLAAALESLARRSPGAVLLDLTLPDSEGLETYRSIRNRNPDVPVVVVTGVQEAGLGQAAVEQGAQDFLAKGSVTEDRLTETILYAVARAGRADAGLRDPLTGLAASVLVGERIAEALVRSDRENRYVGVLAVGLDDFASVDDRLGPGSGDELLFAAAERLCEAFPAPTPLGRVAVDEFAAVLEGLARPSNAERAGQRALGVLTPEFKLGGGALRLAPAVGIALGRGPADGAALLDRAREAMADQRRVGQGIRLAP